jgi:gliding motility-associated lipoprotein GldH
MKKKFLQYAFLFLLMVSCSADAGRQVFHKFPSDTWKRFENPVLELDISRVGIFYDMWLEVYYDEAAIPENFSISLIMSSPSGEVRSRTIELEFRHHGKDVGLLKLLLRKDFAFSEEGLFTCEIENRSQDIETHGLKKIGIVLENVQ